MTETAQKTPGTGMPKVRAIERAVSVMRSFNPAKPKLTLTEIAKATGLDKATALRILGTLIECDMIVHDPGSRQYWLGFDLLSLAASVPGQHDLRQIAEPILRQVSVETNCLVFLATPGKEGALCVARAVIDPPVQVQLWNIGEVRPYNQGAGPKLLLAHMSPEDCDTYLQKKLPSANPRTITDASELSGIVKELRGSNEAFSKDDIIEGLSAQAHTVRNEEGKVAAVVSVVGLNPEFSSEGRERISLVLSDAASRLSRHLCVAGLL